MPLIPEPIAKPSLHTLEIFFRVRCDAIDLEKMWDKRDPAIVAHVKA